MRRTVKVEDLGRGSICHLRAEYGNHFAVILNLDWPPKDGVVYFSVATSKVDKYPSFIDDEIVRLADGSYPCFDRPTVINLRSVSAIALNDLLSQPEFSLRTQLSTAIQLSPRLAS